MDATTPAIRELAARLIAREAAHAPSEGAAGAAVMACERLRLPLARLAGVAGFRSLMTRAMALAAAEVPWLASVQVRADGTLEGFEATRGRHDAAAGADAGGAVLAQLLGLLVTFIGEPLTLRLVRDAWPDEAADETERGAGGRP